MAKKLYGAIKRYNTLLKREADAQVSQATTVFWQLCERQAQGLIDSCASGASPALCRQTFANNFETVYDRFCPNVTSRQMEAWARARPDLSFYRNGFSQTPARTAPGSSSTTSMPENKDDQ